MLSQWRMRERWTAPCGLHMSVPGQATPCCSHRLARASTSSRTTSIAAASSRSWSRNLKKNLPREQVRERGLTMPRSLQPDRQLFGATVALCFIGAVMVFSASAVTLGQQTGNGYTFLLRQLLWVALGIGGMFWLMKTDYRKLLQPRVIFTGLSVTLVLLIAVFFLDRSHQTHRWIRLGPLSLQPSELAKLVVIVYLAWLLELRRAPRGFGVNNPLHTLAPALGTVLLVTGLVLAEPDMG